MSGYCGCLTYSIDECPEFMAVSLTFYHKQHNDSVVLLAASSFNVNQGNIKFTQLTIVYTGSLNQQSQVIDTALRQISCHIMNLDTHTSQGKVGGKQCYKWMFQLTMMGKSGSWSALYPKVI